MFKRFIVIAARLMKRIEKKKNECKYARKVPFLKILNTKIRRTTFSLLFVPLFYI